MRVPTKLLGILAVIIILATATGCDSGNGGNSQALTEIDFAEDSALRADPEEGVIVTFLESPMSEEPENDTGEVGIDEIPVTYPETVEQTFCWTDDNSEAMYYMQLKDIEESEVLRLDVNGDCVTATIEPGDYVMEFHHDDSTGDPLPIFIIPDSVQNQQAMKTDGLFNGFKVVIGKILRGIQNTISDDARAQTVQQNINTLLSTNSCRNCDLFKANLFQADLTGVDLFQADLRKANLNGAKLVGANLLGADLRNAILYEADLTNIKLTICRGNAMCDIYFRDDTFFIFRAAGATFLKATWCDGETKCVSHSVGTCCIPPPIASLTPFLGCKHIYLPICDSFDVN